MSTSRILFFAAATAVIAALGCATPAFARDLSAAAGVVRSEVAGHAYQSGGVSKEDVADMQRHISPYDLRLVFSEGRHNAYAADVRLRITDARGHRSSASKTPAR